MIIEFLRRLLEGVRSLPGRLARVEFRRSVWEVMVLAVSTALLRVFLPEVFSASLPPDGFLQGNVLLLAGGVVGYLPSVVLNAGEERSALASFCAVQSVVLVLLAAVMVYTNQHLFAWFLTGVALTWFTQSGLDCSSRTWRWYLGRRGRARRTRSALREPLRAMLAAAAVMGASGFAIGAGVTFTVWKLILGAPWGSSMTLVAVWSVAYWVFLGIQRRLRPSRRRLLRLLILSGALVTHVFASWHLLTGNPLPMVLMVVSVSVFGFFWGLDRVVDLWYEVDHEDDNR
ncbi:hypothetical protein [Deinococcus pimensis]|uniref:hypothetical protein n=1 Tax=Deinococcus pimensis TaxID=309888 RepID=UPI000486A4CE|nr:hypothetical protein [Deinococcus pimensis]